jgi:hypothetical protein
VNHGSPSASPDEERHHVRVLQLGGEHDLAPEAIDETPAASSGERTFTTTRRERRAPSPLGAGHAATAELSLDGICVPSDDWTCSRSSALTNGTPPRGRHESRTGQAPSTSESATSPTYAVFRRGYVSAAGLHANVRRRHDATCAESLGAAMNGIAARAALPSSLHAGERAGDASAACPGADPAESTFAGLSYRNIGRQHVGRMATSKGSGRSIDHLRRQCVGGVWKSTNGGTTWTRSSTSNRPVHRRPRARTGEPDVIYVGTGEANVRNSVSFGRASTSPPTAERPGSTSAFRHAPHLAHRHQPKDPKKVYVARDRHSYGPNEERGVFMTADGGSTGRRSSTPTTARRGRPRHRSAEPEHPLRGMWYFDRKQWTFRSGDENGGVYAPSTGA